MNGLSVSVVSRVQVLQQSCAPKSAPGMKTQTMHVGRSFGCSRAAGCKICGQRASNLPSGEIKLCLQFTLVEVLIGCSGHGSVATAFPCREWPYSEDALGNTLGTPLWLMGGVG